MKWKTVDIKRVMELRGQGFEFSEISKKIHRPTEDIRKLCSAAGFIKGERVLEKNLTCDACKKTFARQSNLTVHKRGHPVDPMAGYVFPESNNRVFNPEDWDLNP